MIEQFTPFIAAFLVSASVTTLATVFVRLLAVRIGAVARPQNDRWNSRAVPLLGGVAIWIGITAGVPLWPSLAFSRELLTVYAVGTALFLVGLVDDFLNLKPGTKLTAQIAGACVAVVLLPRAGWLEFPAPLNTLIAIVWVVGITNAFNLLDNMDGVCAGVAVVAAVSYALANGSHHPAGLLMAGAVGGAAAGFLIFNFHPASIFLGDSGSLLIGSLFALLSLSRVEAGQNSILPAIAVPMLVLLIPIFDTTFVTLSRKLAKRSASVGGRDHTSHRLVALGFSERQTALVLYGLAAAGGGAAAAMQHATELGIVAAWLLVIAFMLLAVSLSSVRVYDGQDFSLLRAGRYTPLLLDVAYKRRIFEILLDVLLAAVAYYIAYVLRFDQDLEENRHAFEQSLPIVIACQLLSSFVAGVYRGVWRYISLTELSAYARAAGFGALSSILALLYLYRFEGYSRAVFIIYAMTVGLLLVGSRVSFRIIGETAGRSRSTHQRAIIYGAGDAGVLLVRELVNNPKHGLRPIGFIDDAPAKLQRRILGIRVLGTGAQFEAIARQHRPDVLVVSSSKVASDRVEQVNARAAELGVSVLQLDFRLRPLARFQPPRAISRG